MLKLNNLSFTFHRYILKCQLQNSIRFALAYDTKFKIECCVCLTNALKFQYRKNVLGGPPERKAPIN